MRAPKRSLDTDFVEVDPNGGAWNVIRSEFDEILLRHAEESGTSVFQEYKVTGIDFDPADALRPVAAHYARCDGREGTIAFDYLVDASGRQGIMSTKYLKNRRMNASLKNTACWGYWRGGKTYQPGTKRENAPWFEALTDQTGWSWYIPLHDGTYSVGIVMDFDASIRKRRLLGQSQSLEAHYVEQFKFSPGLKALLSEATIVPASVQCASDYSYSASAHAGPHYRLVGDASGEPPCFVLNSISCIANSLH